MTSFVEKEKGIHLLHVHVQDSKTTLIRFEGLRDNGGLLFLFFLTVNKQLKNFFSFFKFIYFLAALGLRCCARAFSNCGERELLFVAVCGLLIAVASLVVEHRP